MYQFQNEDGYLKPAKITGIHASNPDTWTPITYTTFSCIMDWIVKPILTGVVAGITAAYTYPYVMQVPLPLAEATKKSGNGNLMENMILFMLRGSMVILVGLFMVLLCLGIMVAAFEGWKAWKEGEIFGNEGINRQSETERLKIWQ
jgi:hypothetical protein